MTRLSVLIPSKNEPYLQRTVEDILNKIEGDTEIIVGLDRCKETPNQRILDDDRVRWVTNDLLEMLPKTQGKENQGQRAMTNCLARLSEAEYLMKVDAHCSFSQGFDTALLSEIDNKTILAPLLLVLDPITWAVNGKKQMAQFGFDKNLVMQHLEGDVGETPCLQGCAWMVSKDNYWKWNLGDETLPSWGMQGVELGIKAYLNGGICKTTRSAYVGHLFRHKDEEFPYEREKEPGKLANEIMKSRYLNQSIAGLIRKYNYFCDWTLEDVNNLNDMIK